MDIHDERDDLADDDDVTTYRARARDLLSEISRLTKEALSHQGINNLDLFFVVPSDSIITFGTTLDPDDAEWAVVGEVVSGVVQRLLGLAGTRCRSVVCASTNSVADHQPLQGPADWTSGGCSPSPLTPTLQHTRAEQ